MESMVLNNRYRLLELIGSGGMAVVYRGVDTLLQRRVAVKVLRDGFSSDPAFLARFQREAQAAANLDHPNVVTVYDVGQEGDRHYIVMEYVDGQDLKTLIRQKNRLSVAEALDITIQVCAGVGHAHKMGLIHCDIKPQNVLVTQDGRAKVTDFGIARALSEAGLTESDTVWGSPTYFSPEQAAGEPPSPASDVYSIGVMLYEMLAGVPPFQAEKSAALALKHMREEPPALASHNPQVPPQLEWIIRKVLAKEPAARYRTAEQLALVLDEYRKHAQQVTGWQPVSDAELFPGPPPQPAPDDSAMEFEPLPIREEPDGLVWLLGVIALIAVVGLVPLWALVYRAYSAAPMVPPTPTNPPLVTRTSEMVQVEVPELVGQKVGEAQRALDQVGLTYTVEEQEEADVEPGVILSQSPSPGQMVPRDAEIALVVNRSGRELEMPDLVGYPLEMVRSGLESDGLIVVTEEAWAGDEEGTVLAQEPEAGAQVRAGDAVTLTISGGTDVPIPLEVNLADLLVLKNAELPQRTFRPGGVVGVTLRWEALRSFDTHYVVFVHLIGPDGRLVAQDDSEPVVPTASWTPGVEVVDPHQFDIPSGAPSGTCRLRVGMYPQGSPSARLSVVDAGLTTVDSNSILIAEVEIQP